MCYIWKHWKLDWNLKWVRADLTKLAMQCCYEAWNRKIKKVATMVDAT